jgi:hypothetical protein
MVDRTQKSIAVIDAAPRYAPLPGLQQYVKFDSDIFYGIALDVPESWVTVQSQA